MAIENIYKLVHFLLNLSVFFKTWEMKVFILNLLVLSIYVLTADAGGGDPCGRFIPRLLQIMQNYDNNSTKLKEQGLSDLESAFRSKTFTIDEQREKISSIILEVKEKFDILEDGAYVSLGSLINRNPKVIARKMIQSSSVTEFPFLCVMDDADSISLNANLANKAVHDFGNKLLSEL